VIRRRFLASLPFLAALPNAHAEDSFRVGVIGHTGHGNFGHGLDTMWLDLPGFLLVGVADADPAGLASASSRLRGTPGFASYQEMLSTTRPDLVAIAPRHAGERVPMSLAALEAGARGLYFEKPFCRTPAEADLILAAAARSGARIAVAHRNRYHPALPGLRRFLASGRLGRVLEFRGRGKEDARGGALDAWVLGSHVANLAFYLGGAPLAASATLYQDGRPCTPADVREGDEALGLLAGDEVHARFDLTDGLPFFFDSRKDAGTREAGFGLQIIGTEGIVDLRIDQEPLVHVRFGHPFRPVPEPSAWLPLSPVELGEPLPPPDFARRIATHRSAAEDLADAIRSGREPLCSGADALLTVEMMAAIFASHRDGGRRVSWPLAVRNNPLADWKEASLQGAQ